MATDDGVPIRPAAHHRLWLDLLCDTDIQRLLIIAPPESAKTTWLMAYVATTIGFFPERPRIMAAVSGPVAKKRSMSLRNLVESPEFQDAFPGVLPAKSLPWTNEEWSVAPDGRPHPGRIHPTISSYGTGGSIIGSRAAEAIGDDVLDFDNTRTAHQRDTVDHWLHNSFFSRVMSRIGRIIMIGTAWHHDDPYERLKSNGGWVVCHVPLLSDGPEVKATISYPVDFAGRRLGTLQNAEV